MAEQRKAIIKLFEKGKRVREIGELLDVPKSTVHDIIARLMKLVSMSVGLEVDDPERRGQKLACEKSKEEFNFSPFWVVHFQAYTH